MENINEVEPRPNVKIEKNSILFFDMDGTLVDTDFANFLSYKKAIQTVIQLDLGTLFNPKERFNRTSIKKVIPNLTDVEYDNIIQQKEKNYKDYLPQTKINKLIADILIQYSKTNKTVLVTNCRKDRALMTLNYHNLTDKFSTLFFRQSSANENRINKFTNAISVMNLSAKEVLVFENEKQEIEDALAAGILINNILSV